MEKSERDNRQRQFKEQIDQIDKEIRLIEESLSNVRGEIKSLLLAYRTEFKWSSKSAREEALSPRIRKRRALQVQRRNVRAQQLKAQVEDSNSETGLQVRSR
jgi:hypothetical protein